MTGSRLLLTGAGGFVGRQILLNLDSNFEVHATSRNPRPLGRTLAAYHQIDLKNAAQCVALIDRVRPDILVHAAWNTEHGAFWEAADNDEWLAAGVAMFDAFTASGGRRIVGCGSGAEYSGASVSPRRENETDHSVPETRYGRTKLALSRHLQSLPVSSSWARIFLTYGEGEGDRRLVPSICKALLAGEPVRCSSGRQVRDFLEVRDVGRAIAKLATSDVEGAINLGYNDPTTIAEVATTLGELAGQPDLIHLGALPDRAEAQMLIPCLRRQSDELGFTPVVGLRQGLSDALRYWSRHR